MGANWGKSDAMLTATNSFYIGGYYVCANVGESPSRNATARIRPSGMECGH